MDEKTKTAALNVLDKLLVHSITKIFYDPSITNEDESDNNSTEDPANQIDFSIIKSNIENNKYSSIQQFFNDVDKVWKNIEAFDEDDAIQSTDNAYITLAAEECSRLFNKLCTDENLFTIGSWCKAYAKAASQLKEVLQQCPIAKFKSIFSGIGNNGNGSNNNKVKNGHTLYTEQELENFVKASELLRNKIGSEFDRDICDFITKYQPEIDNGEKNVVISVTNLKPQTLSHIKVYIKDYLQKLGTKYPD